LVPPPKLLLLQVQLHLLEYQKRIADLVGKDEKLKDVLPQSVLDNIRKGSQVFESVSILFLFILGFSELLDEFGDDAMNKINNTLFEKLSEVSDKRSLHLVQKEGAFGDNAELL
jgi:class 3 adenylate cyclase